MHLRYICIYSHIGSALIVLFVCCIHTTDGFPALPPYLTNVCVNHGKWHNLATVWRNLHLKSPEINSDTGHWIYPPSNLPPGGAPKL